MCARIGRNTGPRGMGVCKSLRLLRLESLHAMFGGICCAEIARGDLFTVTRAIVIGGVMIVAFVWWLKSLALAHAGTCRVYSDGTNTVEACENGSYTVTDRQARKRVYGDMNAGFERYAGQEERPVFERR